MENRKLKKGFWWWLKNEADFSMVVFMLGFVVGVGCFICGTVLGIAMNPWFFCLLLGIPVGILICFYGVYLADQRDSCWIDSNKWR